MSEQADGLMNQIQTWVVNDYFTPNIKAEVILDTLLTPYVPQILRSQRGDIDAVFLTKEMSIIETPEDQEQVDSHKAQSDNRGSKIDYVLADKSKDRAYLVELKTTDSSIDDGQLSLYTTLAGQTSNFGDVLGIRLLQILDKECEIHLGAPEGWTDDGILEDAWEKIWSKRKNYQPENRYPEESGSYTEMAMELIKTKGWAWRGNLRSRKYVYTLGQLMDFLHSKHCGNGLWNRQVELVYLTPWLPKDSAKLGKKIFPAAFVPYFETEQPDTLLTDIINRIYGGSHTWRN